MIPVETIKAIQEEIQLHVLRMKDGFTAQMLPRNRFALLIGHSAAISELAKLGLKKIEGEE